MNLKLCKTNRRPHPISPQFSFFENINFSHCQANLDCVKISTMPQTNPVKFLLEVKGELLKVTWPTKNEVIRLTTIVVLISLVVGIFVGGLDFVFTKLIEIIIKK